MKKLLLAALLIIPIVGSARMFPTEFSIKAVCWDNSEEAIEYHQEVLGEYPIGKGWISNKSGPTFAAIMFNPVKPSWTFLNFHESTKGDIVVCAITGGAIWDIINPGDEGGRLEL